MAEITPAIQVRAGPCMPRPVAEGQWSRCGRVGHMFFDCGGGCALAFLQRIDVPGVPADPDTRINHSLGLPNGTFHFAFRCDTLTALEARRREL
ncbi:MAG: VOC family protein, partial [bacterium]